MAETSSDEKEMETSGQNEGGIPYKVKAGAFLAFAGGFGLLAGFGGALAQVSDCSVISILSKHRDVSASAYVRWRSRILGPMTWGQGNLWRGKNRQGAKAVFGLSANQQTWTCNFQIIGSLHSKWPKCQKSKEPSWWERGKRWHCRYSYSLFSPEDGSVKWKALKKEKRHQIKNEFKLLGNWRCSCIKSFSLGDLICCGRWGKCENFWWRSRLAWSSAPSVGSLILSFARLQFWGKADSFGGLSVLDQFFRLWGSFLLHLEDDGCSEYVRI